MAKCLLPSLSELQVCECCQGRGSILEDCGAAFTLSLGAGGRERVVMGKHKYSPKQTQDRGGREAHYLYHVLSGEDLRVLVTHCHHPLLPTDFLRRISLLTVRSKGTLKE